MGGSKNALAGVDTPRSLLLRSGAKPAPGFLPERLVYPRSRIPRLDTPADELTRAQPNKPTPNHLSPQSVNSFP